MEKNKNVSMQTNSKEEEETQPLECKKKTLLMFPQLSDQAILSSKGVNDSLSTSFIGDRLDKKLKTWLSLVNIMNPHPISSTIPRTRASTRATQTMIDI
jgi:hypothetical protein